jgi:hypothetical protein
MSVPGDAGDGRGKAVKSLSLRQPWAWLVVQGYKPLENRRWNTSFRGRFLVHAAKGMTRDEYDDASDFAVDVLAEERKQSRLDVRAWLFATMPPHDKIERGGIVGVATIVDVILPCRGVPTSLFDDGQCRHPWHMAGQHGFQLADIRSLPFVPQKGALGFFDVPIVGALATMSDAGDLK